MEDLISLMCHFYSTELFALEAVILFFRQFFVKNTLIFEGSLSVPHLVDNYAKVESEWGQNFM